MPAITGTMEVTGANRGFDDAIARVLARAIANWASVGAEARFGSLPARAAFGIARDGIQAMNSLDAVSAMAISLPSCATTYRR